MGFPGSNRYADRASRLLCGHPDLERSGFQGDPNPLMRSVVEPVALLRQRSPAGVFRQRPAIEQAVALPAHRRRRICRFPAVARGIFPDLQANLHPSLMHGPEQGRHVRR